MPLRAILLFLFATLTIPFTAAQQNQSDNPPDNAKPAVAAKKEKNRKETASTTDKPVVESNQPTAQPGPSATEAADKSNDKSNDKEEHFDVSEIAPVVTHHQIAVRGKNVSYTATTGRLPIKRGDGKIEAEMFFVAYTVDGQDSGHRPLTFAFNGGPGSASVWLHMGALGPKRVVMQQNGFMPAAPYRLEENPDSLLDRSDIVMVDAMATGYSRAANAELTKKFLGLKGDVQAFGEFIRLYLSRYDRWNSPLFLLGESYGTTRAAGVAGYLADHGIAFNGITLLSMAVE
jgi:carboxypeptidase C (cathepsin A)